jgi:hypothetical protein
MVESIRRNSRHELLKDSCQLDKEKFAFLEAGFVFQLELGLGEFRPIGIDWREVGVLFFFLF